MRIHRVLHPVVVLSIVVAAWTQAGCDKPCNPECGSNERCIDQSCVHCGLPGEKCCYDNAGTFVCDTGECNNAGTNVCPGGSQSGSQCVEGTCPDGGSCVDGLCESPADPCYDGTTAYTFDLVDSDCFKLSFTFYVNSQQEAEQCASDEVAKFDPNGDKQTQACPVVPGTVGSAGLADVCDIFQGTKSPMQFWNCGGDQVEICKKNHCIAGGCTWVDGACP